MCCSPNTPNLWSYLVPGFLHALCHLGYPMFSYSTEKLSITLNDTKVGYFLLFKELSWRALSGPLLSVPGSQSHEAIPSVYEAHFQRVILFQLIKEVTEPSDLMMILKSRKVKLGNHAETELAEVQTTWTPAQRPLRGLRAAKLKYFLSPVLLTHYPIPIAEMQNCVHWVRKTLDILSCKKSIFKQYFCSPPIS